MKKMSQTLIFTIFAMLTGQVFAASASNYPMEAFDGDLENKPSLQNGMR